MKTCTYQASADERAWGSIQGVGLLGVLCFMVALTLGIADDQTNRNGGGNSGNNFIPPRYAVIDLGTSFFPVAINNLGLIAGILSLYLLYMLWDMA